MLTNPSFEQSQGYNGHAADVYRAHGERVQMEYVRGEDNPPAGWRIWYVWDQGWAQPESRYAPHAERVLDGLSGFLMFTFYRVHRGGLLQQVRSTPGRRYRFTVNSHAWSSTEDNPYQSNGAPGAYFELWDTVKLLPDSTGLPNYRARVGIDPTGGSSPFADTVAWGAWATVYNVYHELPPVEVVAQGDTVTVFTEHRFAWPYKHCDAYYDQARLVEITEGVATEDWTHGREQYQRTYVLMPPQATAEWVIAAVGATWGNRRYTVGGSADDAGIGPRVRRVIAVNPDGWPADLHAFFEEHYPGVLYTEMRADTPEELAEQLTRLVGAEGGGSDPSTDPTPAPSGGSKLGLHCIGDSGAVEAYRRIAAAGVVPPTIKQYGRDGEFGWLREIKAISPQTVTVGRLAKGTLDHVNVEGPDLADPETSAELVFRSCLPVWDKHKDCVDYWEVINEQDPPGPAGHINLARFFLRMMELAEPYGIRLALFSYSMGVPEPAEWDAIAATGVFEAAAEGKHAIALHEYGSFPMDAPHLLTRFTYVYDKHILPYDLDIPLLITEYNLHSMAGVDGGEVLRQWALYDAELRRRRYVIGAHLFSWDDIPGWGEFHVKRLADEWEQYVIAQSRAAPVPPVSGPAVNGCVRGVHGPTTLDLESPNDLVEAASVLHLGWYKLLTGGSPRNVDLARALVERGVQPIARLYHHRQGVNRNGVIQNSPQHVIDLIRAGAWIEVHNEPNLPGEHPDLREYNVSWRDQDTIERLCRSWWADAEQVIQWGGKAAIPAMAPTDRNGINEHYSSVRWLERIVDWLLRSHFDEAVDYLAEGRLWLAVHSAVFSRPLNFDPFRPNGHRDDMCLRGYEIAMQIVEGAFGVVPVTVSTEGGVFSPYHLWQLGWSSDPDRVTFEGTSELFYDNQSWGRRVCEAFECLGTLGDLAGMCMWHLKDVGNEWDGAGWYGRGWEQRSPAVELKRLQV